MLRLRDILTSVLRFGHRHILRIPSDIGRLEYLWDVVLFGQRGRVNVGVRKMGHDLVVGADVRLGAAIDVAHEHRDFIPEDLGLLRSDALVAGSKKLPVDAEASTQSMHCTCMTEMICRRFNGLLVIQVAASTARGPISITTAPDKQSVLADAQASWARRGHRRCQFMNKVHSSYAVLVYTFRVLTTRRLLFRSWAAIGHPDTDGGLRRAHINSTGE